MKMLLMNVPDYQARQEQRKQWETEHEPLYLKIINEFCQHHQHELLSINALDFGNDSVSEAEAIQNEINGNYYCYFSTHLGSYYFVYSQEENTARFFESEARQLIGILDFNLWNSD